MTKFNYKKTEQMSVLQRKTFGKIDFRPYYTKIVTVNTKFSTKLAGLIFDPRGPFHDVYTI